MSEPIAILFDIDGTLLGCQGRGLRAMHRAMQRVHGLAPREAVIRPHGKTDPMLFEELASAYGLPLERLAAQDGELRRAYVEEFGVEIRERGGCVLKPGVASLLEALALRPHLVLGLVTGNLESTAWSKLESARLAGYFATGGFGSDSRHRADIVALARARCAARRGVVLASHRTWVVGDTPDDVASGRAHGMRTLAVATGSFGRADLESSEADVVLDGFEDTERVVDILCDVD